MARVVVINPTKAAATGTFTTTVRGFWLSCTGMVHLREQFVVERKKVSPNDEYEPATNENGKIFVCSFPNTIYVDLPAGDYRLNKTASENNGSADIEQVQ